MQPLPLPCCNASAQPTEASSHVELCNALLTELLCTFRPAMMQVLVNGTWGAVCNHAGPLRNAPAATVLCRQLGLGAAGFLHAAPVLRGLGGTPTAPRALWVARVRCGGSEERLQDCSIDRTTADLERYCIPFIVDCSPSATLLTPQAA